MESKRSSARKIGIIVTLSCILLVILAMAGIVASKVLNADYTKVDLDESSLDESSYFEESSLDESLDESGDAEESSNESFDIEEDLFLTRTNYYDTDGKLVYYEGYSYYDNGLLCGSTLFSVNYFENEQEYIGAEYTFLYLYDDNGELTERVLGGFGGVTLGENDGEIVLDYIYDEDGNIFTVSIYPENESIEQEKFGVAPSKTEKIYGDAYNIDTDSAEWAETYLKNAFDEGLETDITECRFIYVNNDDVPELWIDYVYGAAGARVLTQKNGKTDFIYISHGYAEWVEKENLMLTCGGHMDGYWDALYKIEDGEFVLLSSGAYGAIVEDVQHDEDGMPIYTYEWDGVEVTEEEYFEHRMEAFDSALAADADKCVFTCDQCKLLLQAIANGGVYDGSVE